MMNKFTTIINIFKENWTYIRVSPKKHIYQHLGYGNAINIPLFLITLYFAINMGMFWLPIVAKSFCYGITIGWETCQIWGGPLYRFSYWLNHKVLDSFIDIAVANIPTDIALLIYLLIHFKII